MRKPIDGLTNISQRYSLYSLTRTSPWHDSGLQKQTRFLPPSKDKFDMMLWLARAYFSYSARHWPLLNIVNFAGFPQVLGLPINIKLWFTCQSFSRVFLLTTFGVASQSCRSPPPTIASISSVVRFVALLRSLMWAMDRFGPSSVIFTLRVPLKKL